MAVACLGPDSMARSSGPLVSVVVTTYQHVAYIAACLEGILAQRTDFAVEILVGEDESTDGTRAICRCTCFSWASIGSSCEVAFC